jgi:hypothetical protein
MANTTTAQLGGLKKPRRGNSKKWDLSIQGPIKSKISIGKPKNVSSGGSSATSGFNSAVEKEGSRVYREEYKTIRSSDGLFTLQYKELYSIVYITEKQTEVSFKYLPLIKD